MRVQERLENIGMATKSKFRDKIPLMAFPMQNQHLFNRIPLYRKSQLKKMRIKGVVWLNIKTYERWTYGKT